MAERNAELNSFNNPRQEESCLITESEFDEYTPIQKNSRLFKFILYTAKVEIKFNSLIKMIYNTSLYELGWWFLGFWLFVGSPKEMWVIWLLIVHIAKGILGLCLLNNMPKTFDIWENIAKNPNFEEDKMIEMIQGQIQESFIKKWSENKSNFLYYLISTLVCVVMDLLVFIIQVAVFGKDEWILMQTCIWFIIVVFVITDVVYFLWFFTLQFSLPDEIIEPIKKAIFGSVGDLKAFVFSKFSKQEKKENSTIN